jgi:hypothetical protein
MKGVLKYEMKDSKARVQNQTKARKQNKKKIIK